ncbi:hypothetical protein [Chitinophaga sp.]|uniref:hypothetical protein n=1 Tax=Chitinophaga sp. TaxID=1869181 RepID=UPI0031D93C14
MPSKSLRLEIYEESKQELKLSFEKKWETHNLQTFQFLSANLSRCLPAIPESQHKSAYFDILSYKVLQGIDTQFSAKFSGIDDFNEFNYEEIKKHLPALFVSYHTGSYRSAIAFLVKYNINVVLIADPLAYKYSLEKMLQQFQQVKDTFNSTSEFIVYPADRADLTLQIMGKIKQGYSVLAYIDGNAGSNGYLNRDNSQQIPFFGQEIFVRTGLPTMSFYLKVPIIPMLSYYDERLQPRWNVYDPIAPPKGEKSPAGYVDQSIRYLYGILENALQRYTMQWEGWMFLHRYLNIGPVAQGALLTETANISINDKIGLFILDDRYYILNKENYKLMELDKEVFHLFDNKNRDAIIARPIADIQLLYKNRFLIHN